MPAEDLRRIAVFADLPAPMLARLEAIAEGREYADGQPVFAEGGEGDAVFFIRDGHARVDKLIQAGGAETRTLAVLGPGEFFGEMSLFDGRPRSASIVARGALRAYRIPRLAFQELLESGDAAAAGLLFAIIRTCHQRIRSLDQRVVMFHEIGKAIGEAANLARLAEVVLAQLREATGATTGLLAVQLEFFDRLEIASSFGAAWPPAVREAITRHEGLLGRVLKERRGVLVARGAADPALAGAAPAGYETTSLLVEPVLVGDQCLGLLLLGHEAADRFTLDDLSLCESVASQVAQAILNHRHREEEQSRAKLSRRYVRF